MYNLCPFCGVPNSVGARFCTACRKLIVPAALQPEEASPWAGDDWLAAATNAGGMGNATPYPWPGSPQPQTPLPPAWAPPQGQPWPPFAASPDQPGYPAYPTQPRLDLNQAPYGQPSYGPQPYAAGAYPVPTGQPQAPYPAVPAGYYPVPVPQAEHPYYPTPAAPAYYPSPYPGYPAPAPYADPYTPLGRLVPARIPSGATALAPVTPGSLAEFWPRFGALMVDLCVIAVMWFTLLGLAAFAGSEALAMMATFLGPGAYFVGFWATSGRTPGYRAAGLQMVRTDGTKPGFGTAVVRLLSTIISGFPFFLGYFWMLWDRQHQTWHDKISGTNVINLR